MKTRKLRYKARGLRRPSSLKPAPIRWSLRLPGRRRRHSAPEFRRHCRGCRSCIPLRCNSGRQRELQICPSLRPPQPRRERCHARCALQCRGCQPSALIQAIPCQRPLDCCRHQARKSESHANARNQPLGGRQQQSSLRRSSARFHPLSTSSAAPAEYFPQSASVGTSIYARFSSDLRTRREQR